MTHDQEALVARQRSLAAGSEACLDYQAADKSNAIADMIEAQAAEIDRLKAAIKRQAGAAVTIRQATLEEVRHLQEMDRSEYVAAQTLDSEREANAHLTAENDALRAEIARLSSAAGAAGVLLGKSYLTSLPALEEIDRMSGEGADRIFAAALRALAKREPAHD